MSVVSKSPTLFKSAAYRVLSSIISPQSIYLLGEPLFWLSGMRHKKRDIDVHQAKRVLVVRLDDIGDVVMTTPLLRELRRNLPQAWITLIVKPTIYNLVEFCPYIDEVLTYDWNTEGRMRQLRRHFRALKMSVEHLWRRRFELAILPRWDADIHNGTFLAYISGACWRVGYSENTVEHKVHVNRGFDRLFTNVLKANGCRHEVERNLDLIYFLGGNVKENGVEVWIGREDGEFAEKVLKNHHFCGGGLLVALGPGVRETKRRWPLGNFVEVGSWLQREYGARIMMVGDKNDIPLAQEFQNQFGDTFINTVGKTTLRQLGALLKRCDLYVGNDSGPMHLAAAVGIPVVEISCHPLSGLGTHRNSPKRFGPWGGMHHVLQPEMPRRPCSDSCTSHQPHCILGIPVERVKGVIKVLLSDQRYQSLSRRKCLDCYI